MSESEQYEKVTVASDGVTVDKRFEEDEFPVPAIAFEIQSSRDETVTVTLVDEVPEDVAVEDLGFHPEYGSEYWTIDENQITFEREIEAEAEYTTVYGIRATGTDDVEQFLTEPRIEAVDPPLEETDDAVVAGNSSDVVRDVISGDSDAVPGLEEDDGDDEDVETLDLKDPNDPDDDGASAGSGTANASADDDSSSSSSSSASGDASVNSVAGALAAEMRNGNVDEDDVKLLRKAFDIVADGESGSVDARIQRLQTELADLQAYTDALEEFLDENGTAEALIRDFRSDVEDLQGELQDVGELARGHEEALSSIESTVDGVESSMNSIESEMNDVLEEVESVRSDVDEVEGSVDQVETSVEQVESSVDDVESTVDDVEGSVEAVESSVDQVETTVDDVESTVDDVESSVDEVESELEELESKVGDIDVQDVRGDIEEIESEIDELKEWREQLSSVIGGGD